jgi:hypothetical protein
MSSPTYPVLAVQQRIHTACDLCATFGGEHQHGGFLPSRYDARSFGIETDRVDKWGKPCVPIVCHQCCEELEDEQREKLLSDPTTPEYREHYREIWRVQFHKTIIQFRNRMERWMVVVDRHVVPLSKLMERERRCTEKLTVIRRGVTHEKMTCMTDGAAVFE